MHEINEQSEVRLTEALRQLATSSPHGAPAEIRAGLAQAFHRHHTRRRRIRRVGVAALVTCVALMAALASLRSTRNPPPVKPPSRESAGSVPVRVPDTVAAANAAAVEPRPMGKRPMRKVTTHRATYSRQFLALPGYDPEVPADELHVVRVQLPASALWQMGAPVSPDTGARRVMADFVVSQDGTPYAVRLVQ
jgi:hypothetical protein